MNSPDPVPFIQFDLVESNAVGSLAESPVLGLHCLGREDSPGGGALPIQHISVPLLNCGDTRLYELWRTDAPCRGGRFQDIIFRCNDTALFGVIEIDERSPASNDGETGLRAAAETAYRQIFSLLDANNVPHLWRTWNYLPHIHAEEAGLERYRQFNIGRHDAFINSGRSVDDSPAASALGTAGGRFSIAFIAGRTPPIRIENPRQVSAFTYPSVYGPRSPTFTRAVTVTRDGHQALFISGTASIVGHETIHREDVAAQTQETVANLTALLEQANSGAGSALYTLRDLTYRIYIRHADDCGPVRQVIDALTVDPARARYVQADICRRDLLVEIEAFAVKPLPSENP